MGLNNEIAIIHCRNFKMSVISAEPIIGFGFCSSSPEIVTSFYEIFFGQGGKQEPTVVN